MARTRRGVIDQDNSWIIREELEWNPDEPVAPQDDNIVVNTFAMHSTGDVSYSQLVIWGVGLISFGPVTAEQTDFMTNIGTDADLAGFPGDFVAFGYSANPVTRYEYGLKSDYFYVTSSFSPTVTINPDGISIIGETSVDFYFGLDFGGYQHTSTAGSHTLLYFSDLDVTNGSGVGDLLTGTAQPETLRGLGGDDWLLGNAGGDRLDGGVGSDLLEGGDGNDRLFGEENDDALRGGAGNDLLSGGNGNDVLAPGAGLDQVDGGDGIDRLELDYGGSSTSLDFTFDPTALISTPGGGLTVANVEAVGIRGGQYVDVIEGTAFADELFGGGGNDLLIGGGGNDLLEGGAPGSTSLAVLPGAGTGFDDAVSMSRFFDLVDNAFIFNSTTVPHATLHVDVHTAPFEFDQEIHRYLAVDVTDGATLTIDVDLAIFQVDTQVAIYDSIGGLVASNDDGDYFELGGFDPGTSNGQDSLLTYTFGAAGTYYVDISSFVGTADHTSDFEVHFSLTSTSVATADVLMGGAGNDTYVVNALSDEVVELAGEGTDLVRTALTYTLGANVDNLALAGVAAVNGTGNALANILDGNGAANILSGGAGADTLNGRAGADSMRGGDGNDTYYADNIGDRAVEVSALGGIDTVRSSVGFTLGLNVENLILSGTAALTGKGNDLANTITGNSGANIIDGRGGADSMRGGLGNDTYYADNAGDRAVETSASGGVDIVRASVGFTLGANVERLYLTGSAAINGKGNGIANQIYGNGANNILSGLEGDDYLSASSGDDRVYGGLGDDRLYGGSGADNFYFDSTLSAATNVDRIFDFVVADDSIILDRTIFTAFVVNGTLASAAFYNGSAAHDADDRIVYDSASGRIYYDADGNGAAAQVLFATVNAGLALTNADFIIIS